jgi:Bifunctional DNA primase/polymerase, N-terminal
VTGTFSPHFDGKLRGVGTRSRGLITGVLVIAVALAVAYWPAGPDGRPATFAWSPPAAKEVSTVGVLEIASAYLDAQLSVVPVRTDGTKRPLIKWVPYQNLCATRDELRGWFAVERHGIGIVAGKASGNLEVIDVDEAALVEPFLQLAVMHVPEVARAPLVRTPSAGAHLYLRYTGTVPGNRKLATRKGDPQKGEPLKATLIETRGTGGFCVAPGSPAACHPLKKTYDLVRGDFAHIPILTEDEHALLMSAAMSFTQLEDDPKGQPKSGIAKPSSGSRPGDVFNQRASWVEILEPHGWTVERETSGVGFWRRPAKKEHGHSATTDFGGHGLLYVFSSNAAPFEPERGYSKFSAFALLPTGATSPPLRGQLLKSTTCRNPAAAAFCSRGLPRHRDF